MLISHHLLRGAQSIAETPQHDIASACGAQQTVHELPGPIPVVDPSGSDASPAESAASRSSRIRSADGRRRHKKRERDMSEASRKDLGWIEGTRDGSRFFLPPAPNWAWAGFRHLKEKPTPESSHE